MKVYKRTWFWQKKSSITRKEKAVSETPNDKESKRKKSKSLFSSSSSKKKNTSNENGTKKKKKKKDGSESQPPHVYLCAILESRGYSLEEFMSLDTAYHNTPTPYQEASYGSHIIDVVRRGQPTELKELMSTGLSPNACNQHGESLVHMACRRGESECLNVLVEYGATLKIADDYGRTPLHDACWAPEPNFEVVEIIMKEDIRLFNIQDGRQQTPLSYVRRDVWRPWKKFLRSKVDEYWPARDPALEGPEKPPALTQKKPNSRKVPVPKETLPIELAAMVSQGKMDPAEAMFLKHETEDDDGSQGGKDDDSDSESDDETLDSSYDSDESDSDFSFDEDEMAEILHNVGATMPLDWKN